MHLWLTRGVAQQAADFVSRIGASGPRSLHWCFLRLEQLSDRQGVQDSWGCEKNPRCFLYRRIGGYTCVCAVCIGVFVPLFFCGQGVWGSRSLRKGPCRTSSTCKQEVIVGHRCPLGLWKGQVKRLRLQALEAGVSVNSACARPHLHLTQPQGAGAQVGQCRQTLAGSPCTQEGGQEAGRGLGGTS